MLFFLCCLSYVASVPIELRTNQSLVKSQVNGVASVPIKLRTNQSLVKSQVNGWGDWAKSQYTGYDNFYHKCQFGITFEIDQIPETYVIPTVFSKIMIICYKWDHTWYHADKYIEMGTYNEYPKKDKVQMIWHFTKCPMRCLLDSDTTIHADMIEFSTYDYTDSDHIIAKTSKALVGSIQDNGDKGKSKELAGWGWPPYSEPFERWCFDFAWGDNGLYLDRYTGYSQVDYVWGEGCLKKRSPRKDNVFDVAEAALDNAEAALGR